MITVTLKLPDELQSKLQTRAGESGHASIEDHIVALVRADVEETDGEYQGDGPEHLKVKDDADLEAKLLEAQNSPASEMTDANWEEMQRRFIERYNKRAAANANVHR